MNHRIRFRNRGTCEPVSSVMFDATDDADALAQFFNYYTEDPTDDSWEIISVWPIRKGTS